MAVNQSLKRKRSDDQDDEHWSGRWYGQTSISHGSSAQLGDDNSIRAVNLYTFNFNFGSVQTDNRSHFDASYARPSTLDHRGAIVHLETILGHLRRDDYVLPHSNVFRWTNGTRQSLNPRSMFGVTSRPRSVQSSPSESFAESP